MSKSDTHPKVDSFLGKTQKWREEFEKLRPVILGCGLTEELKWGKPCYTFEDKNVVIMQGFKDYAALLFCKGVLLKDPKGVLVKVGENSQSARQIRFTSLEQAATLMPVVKAYLREAIEVEKAGMEVEYKKTSDYAVPEELQKKLAESAEFKTAFEKLTPGRQRGYLLHFSGAKQSKTREARIEKCVPHILAGKGWNE